MKIKPGLVIISTEDVVITKFTFNNIDGKEAQILALNWAKQQIDKELSKIEDQ